MAKPGNYEIPFDSKGNLLHYPENEYDYPKNGGDPRVIEPTWKGNFVFEDTLRLLHTMRGRSAAYFYFESQTTGKKYPMFLKDFEEVMKVKVINKGVVSGTWTFVKRGQNYGLTMTKEQPKKVSEEVEGPALYLLDEGNPDTVIPVFTDQPKHIRSDVGNEDHGGMPYEDFERVCSFAEIKRIKSLADLPADLRNAYPYGGGTVAGTMVSCGELCNMMDENGIVQVGEEDY